MIFRFFLVTPIFAVAIDKRGPKNVYGFAIGLTIAADILTGGSLTGTRMNPGCSFGSALIGGRRGIHWVYWAGPIVGGSLAALICQDIQIGKQK